MSYYIVMNHNHPRSVVYIRIHPWSCTFSEFGQMYNDMCYNILQGSFISVVFILCYNILQSSFTVLKFLSALLAHPTIPPIH